VASNEWRPTAQADQQSCYQVIKISGGTQYLFGPDDAPRINVGKTLQKVSLEFRVLRCGPGPIAANKMRRAFVTLRRKAI
jgi:hypothetical protein